MAANSLALLPGMSPFAVKVAHIQITPCDERRYAGDIEIRPDAVGGRRKSAGEAVQPAQNGPGLAPRRIHDVRSCWVEKS